jgi:dihydrofolate reductase
VRRLVLKMSMTLDGYVAGPQGELDWMVRTRSPEGAAWVEGTLWQAGAHLMGRRTYASMVEYWPTSTHPLAAPMNALQKIVFTRSASLALEPTTVPAPGWDNTRVLGSDLATDIAALKAESGKDLLAHARLPHGVGARRARNRPRGLAFWDFVRLVRVCLRAEGPRQAGVMRPKRGGSGTWRARRRSCWR